MTDGLRIGRPGPWRSKSFPDAGVARVASASRDGQGKNDQHRERPARDAPDQPPIEGVILAKRSTRTAALREGDEPRPDVADSDPADAAQTLARRISANRRDSIAAQAHIEAVTVKIVIDR